MKNIKLLIVSIIIFLTPVFALADKSIVKEKREAYILTESEILVLDSQKDIITAKINVEKYGETISGFGISDDHSKFLINLINDKGDGLSDPVISINTRTNGVSDDIKGLPNVYRSNFAVTPNGEFAYVGESLPDAPGDQLGVIDLKSSFYIGPVGGFIPQEGIERLQVIPDSKTAITCGHTAIGNDEIISFIDVKAHSVLKTINVPEAYSPLGGLTTGITISKDSKKAYMPSSYSDRSVHGWKNIVAVIDLEKQEFSEYIALPENYGDSFPFSVEISPDNKLLYVLQVGDSNHYHDKAVITTIDLKLNKIIDINRIKLEVDDEPHHIRLHPNGKKIYIIGHDESIAVYDINKNEITKYFKIMPGVRDVVF